MRSDMIHNISNDFCTPNNVEAMETICEGEICINRVLLNEIRGETSDRTEAHLHGFMQEGICSWLHVFIFHRRSMQMELFSGSRYVLESVFMRISNTML